MLEIKYHLIYLVYPERRRYTAWLLACATLAIHIAEEAARGFLRLWNPEVAALHLSFLRFNFPVWITLLALGVLGLLILSYWVRRGTWWTTGAAYALIFLMLSNGIAHLSFSLRERAWMPGAYSSPLLLLAGINLWMATVRRPSDSSG